MKHLFIPFLLLIFASICYATSNITFSGGGYQISVLLSDEDCKVVGLNVSADNPNIISISINELTAFSKAESDRKRKTIHLVLPETKRHKQEGHPTLGGKEGKGSPDRVKEAAGTEV